MYKLFDSEREWNRKWIDRLYIVAPKRRRARGPIDYRFPYFFKAKGYTLSADVFIFYLASVPEGGNLEIEFAYSIAGSHYEFISQIFDDKDLL